jgi:4-oxalocrotonate tautomerase
MPTTARSRCERPISNWHRLDVSLVSKQITSSEARKACRARSCCVRESGESQQGVWIVPLVRISLHSNADHSYAAAIGDAVHQALVQTMNVPADDKFQIITGHGSSQIVYPREYLGIRHTDAIVIIQITLNSGRTVEQKRALYAAVADLLGAAPGVPRSDIIINLVEVVKENWSFGDGIAQYAT